MLLDHHTADADDEFQLPDYELERHRKNLCSLNSIQLGNVGELIAKLDLIERGMSVFMADPGDPIDMMVGLSENTIRGLRTVRVQVKAAPMPCAHTMTLRTGPRAGYSCKKSPSYHFSTCTRAGGRNDQGKRVGKKLTKEHCDVVALVSADVRKVDYFLVEEIRGISTDLYLSGSNLRVVGQYPLERLFDRGAGCR